MKPVDQISVETAVSLVQSGQRLIVGGFGMTGYPIHLVNALADSDIGELTYIANNVGEPGLGGGRLLRNGQIKKAIGSYFTSNKEAVDAYLKGEMECELIPQGSLGEALRAAGAGLGGFFTPTAAGTELAKGKESRVINGKEMIFVEPIAGDVAFVRAWRADTAGNLQYRMTENNFNQAAATAATLVIAEVGEIVAVGEIAPEHIHTPGCYVDYLVQATLYAEELGTSGNIKSSLKKVDEQRMNMARAALAELNQGEIVNLGIGIPTLVSDLITEAHGINLHTENGMLGVGPSPEEGGALDFPVNAGKIPVTALAGSSYFDTAASFGMIRGGHVDVAIMGGLQVDEAGNLANWAIPGKPLLGVGGAMDLASGASRLIITMTHVNRDGSSKLVPQCDLPLTARNVVNVVITDLATFRFIDQKLHLTALMPGVTLEQVQEATDVEFVVGLS